LNILIFIADLEPENIHSAASTSSSAKKKPRMSAAQAAYVALEEKKIALFAERLKRKKVEKEKVKEDEDYHFLMSSLPTIRMIKDKVRFRIEFYELLEKHTF
jgi:hypothetical protein